MAAARRRVGLLGGTFDPIHMGHLIVGEWVRDALGLEELRLLVAGDPWMKGRESPARHRVAMARAAVACNPAIMVDDRETRREGPTYTAETLAELHREDPDVEWTFLLGADAAVHLPEWHDVDRALSLARFTVVARPGTSLPDHHLMAHVDVVEAPLVEISSTEVRAAVAAGHSIRHRVPEPVIHHIRGNMLYTTPTPGAPDRR
jgi:nicotinate-nucleotide adenylyltransferase